MKPRRKPVGRALIEAYYRSRRRESTPARTGLSVALGVFIGCLPVYGFHLILCFGAARLLRLSGPLAYIAAHLNNPWTAPLLLYLEAGVGRLLTAGEWIRVSPAALREMGGLEVGRDLLIGSVVVGAVLGVVHGLGAFVLAGRSPTDPILARLIDRTTRRYAHAGIRIWETVRGKMRFDPVYLGLLRSGLIRPGRLVDLGCGRGILLSGARAAQELGAGGEWPEPLLPEELPLVGFEIDEAAVATASGALGEEARVELADLRDVAIPEASTVVALDVLHYLAEEEQEDLVRRCAEAVPTGGVLVVREAALGVGWRSHATRLQERVSSWTRGEWRRPFHYRSESGWVELLERHGFEAESEPMSSGTPFSNVLVRGRRI